MWDLLINFLNGLDLYHSTFTQLIEFNPKESILLFPTNTQVKVKNCLIKINNK